MKWLKKIDVVWLIISTMGVVFVYVGIDHGDWMPIIFGIIFIGITSYAAYYKTGCGYNRNCYMPSTKKPFGNKKEQIK